VIRQHSGIVQRLAHLALAAVAFFAIASCGSGGVSGPVPVNDPTRLTILPGTATAFSGLPTTFVISGGTGSYIVSSSNQAVIPVAGAITGSTLVVIPNAVIIDTVVTLTVRDSGTTPTQTATVTVKPGTINNEITITPTSTQGGACAPAICSGGDALAVVTLSQGGIALPGRGVRFEVVSGAFRFITSTPGASTESLDTSITVVTDEAGKARARVRVAADAANQTALLRVTDLASGAFQLTSFIIAQATGTSPGFFVSPTSVTFQGARTDRCADSLSATVFIFGGMAPYTVSSTSSAFLVSRDFVSFSGGSFTVSPNGECVAEPGAPIVVRDSTGRTVTVTVANIPGTAAVPAFSVTPTTVALATCTSVATVIASGGSGHYVASSGSGSVMVTPSSSTTFAIQRVIPSAASTTPINVGISDGSTSATVTVNLTGIGAGTCPTPGFAASTTRVVLQSCTDSVQILLSGGSGTYSAFSASSSISATVSGNILTVKRAVPSPAFIPAVTVTATDGFSNIEIDVSGTGPGVGNCP
jgi:hypothetical protein